jgi:hypothetical protein
MKTKNLLASALSQVLTLATVLMISLAFTACGSDNDKAPEPLPAPKPKTITLDGVEKSVTSAQYKDNGDGNYTLYLNIGSNEYIEFVLNKTFHATDKAIDLAQKEKNHPGAYWSVSYLKDDVRVIYADGQPGGALPVFTTGTLTASGTPGGAFDIKLENGRVVDTDGNEHTLVLSYEGPVEQIYDPLPQPRQGYVTIDGTEKLIDRVDCKDLTNDRFALNFYLVGGANEKLVVTIDRKKHATGKSIDLTKGDNVPDGVGPWTIVYITNAGRYLDGSGDKYDEADYFKTGTLALSGEIPGSINIKLENGRIEENNRMHTITLNYSGPIAIPEVIPSIVPTPKKGYVTFDGVEKKILRVEASDDGGNTNTIYLFLSEDRKEVVKLGINRNAHIGNAVKLTEKVGDNSWHISYQKSDTEYLFNANSYYRSMLPVFHRGLLEMTGSVSGDMDILLRNGIIKGVDGNYHTFVLSYDGGVTEYAPSAPEPEQGYLYLNGVKKTIVRTKYTTGLKAYTLTLYIGGSSDTGERIVISVNRERHFGKEIDLTKADKTVSPADSWSMHYLDKNNADVFAASDDVFPGKVSPFKTGTFKISGTVGETVEAVLKNGRIGGYHNPEQQYSISFHYKGKPEK